MRAASTPRYIHGIFGLGDDLFSSGLSGQNATLPYVGAQLRAVFDLAGANGLQLDLAVRGRSDLSRDQRDVIVQTCFGGCRTEMEQWRLGGVSASATAGLSYQFD